ncbi:tip elongation aberrant protein 1-like isoform X1 [Pararge aegeria]|uniref:tip elongation aberrant protein 1-like isoform X1 n=2 Tax=Pararge aegeria TaxID=116150 RepID=UPI0019CF6F2C|nr:tip elongation aberrant protein 1-like isoform X1 [Pararge aegeria]
MTRWTDWSEFCAHDMWATVESGGAERAAPCARGKHSATLLGGHVYVLGGRGAGGAVPLRDFWRYCLATGRWERLEARGEPPPSLQEHSATAHGTRLYVFGGEAGALSSETPLWIYDTESQIWRKLAGQAGPPARGRGARSGGGACGPRGRRGHSAHALRDCLLVFGGYKDLRGSTNELWAFHYESESWQQVRTSGAGPARHRHAAALHACRLYVHGGQSDLRACADLWHYDTLSRVWTQVRTPPKLSPSARSGHAGLRAGAHLYIFGGETNGHPTNELWRFHFATETWERIVQSVKWPSARVDSRALLIGGAQSGRVRSAPIAPLARTESQSRSRAEAPAGFLREISKLSSFHIRRAARCSYTVLAGDQDSTESLVRTEHSSLSKSRSAYVIDERQPADGDEGSRRDDDTDGRRSELSREPISVPDFADMILPTPVLTPAEATKLVYLDSDEEQDVKREIAAMKRSTNGTATKNKIVPISKSASVKFTREPFTETTITTEDEADMSTSDYASAERVNRLSGASSGFSNPHYLGPDIRNLGSALTPDSGVGPGDIELQDLGERRARSASRNGERQLHLLLVGGKEPPHLALLQCPLSMWSFKLL